MTDRAAPYSRFAAIYDRIGPADFGGRLAAAALDWLDAAGARVTTAVDLACGTGSATLVLAERGITVIGVDRSDEMLRVAAGRARDRHLPIDWRSQDIRCLQVDQRVDLATCFFDSVNYLTDDLDLTRFLGGVTNSLVDDGWFVFDVNTRRRFRETWSNATIVAADSTDLFVTYRSSYDDASGRSPLTVTAFVREAPNGRWRRFDEEHVERAWSLGAIREALNIAGLSIVDTLAFDDRSASFHGPGDESSERVVFFARRAQPTSRP